MNDSDDGLIILDRRHLELMKLWGYSPERLAALENLLLSQEVAEILHSAREGRNVNLAYAAHGSAVLHEFYKNVSTPEEHIGMVNKQLVHMSGEVLEYYNSKNDSEANVELADVVILCLDLMGFINVVMTYADLESITGPFEKGTMLPSENTTNLLSLTMYDTIASVGTKFRKKGLIEFDDLENIIYTAVRAMTGTERIKVILDKMFVNFGRPAKHGVANVTK